MLLLKIYFFIVLDNTPATFDTPGADRPYSPTAEETPPVQSSNNEGDKSKDIIDTHSLGKII